MLGVITASVVNGMLHLASFPKIVHQKIVEMVRMRMYQVGFILEPLMGQNAIELEDGQKFTLDWRLHWASGILTPSTPIPDSIPLVVGLHSWVRGGPKHQLLDAEAEIIQYDPAIQRFIALTFFLENGSNLESWWWGSKVKGQPSSWVEDAVIQVIRARIQDAPQLFGWGWCKQFEDKKY